MIYLIVLGFAAAGNAAMLFFCEQTNAGRHFTRSARIRCWHRAAASIQRLETLCVGALDPRLSNSSICSGVIDPVYFDSPYFVYPDVPIAVEVLR